MRPLRQHGCLTLPAWAAGALLLVLALPTAVHADEPGEAPFAQTEGAAASSVDAAGPDASAPVDAAAGAAADAADAAGNAPAPTSESPVPAAASSSAPAPAGARLRVRQDPLEPLNRSIFAFNDAVDQALLQPVARVYRQAVPALVRTGVRNVLGNVEDAWSAVNHLLQGKGRDAYEMTVRFVTNSTFGLGGLLDVAGEMGLERRSEDLGQTLGRWGVPAGPYLVLPFAGASSLRDTAGLRVDRVAALPARVAHVPTRIALTTLEVVQTRSELLQAGDLLGLVALDRYTFVREAYLARRRNLVYDGNPPEEPEDDLAPAAPVAPR